MKRITKILKRHLPGCFDVEDENGNCFYIQQAFKIEEIWQKRKNKPTTPRKKR